MCLGHAAQRLLALALQSCQLLGMLGFELASQFGERLPCLDRCRRVRQRSLLRRGCLFFDEHLMEANRGPPRRLAPRVRLDLRRGLPPARADERATPIAPGSPSTGVACATCIIAHRARSAALRRAVNCVTHVAGSPAQVL